MIMPTDHEPKAGHRPLRCPLSHSEFALVNWAQSQTGSPGLNKFARRAMFEAVKKAIEQIVQHRGKIPPGVSQDFETWRRDLKQ